MILLRDDTYNNLKNLGKPARALMMKRQEMEENGDDEQTIQYAQNAGICKTINNISKTEHQEIQSIDL